MLLIVTGFSILVTLGYFLQNVLRMDDIESLCPRASGEHNFLWTASQHVLDLCFKCLLLCVFFKFGFKKKIGTNIKKTLCYVSRVF